MRNPAAAGADSVGQVEFRALAPVVARLSGRRRLLLFDGLLALAAIAVELVLTLLMPRSAWPASLPVLMGLSVLCAIPIVLRRVCLPAAVAACLAVLALVLSTQVFPLTHTVAFPVVGYTAAARLALGPAAATTLLLWGPVVVANIIDPAGLLPADASAVFIGVNNGLVAAITFLVGRSMRLRRAAHRLLRQRAAAAELNQAALAAQAVADERRRIARELHDVVAHHVSVIGVLATGARRVLGRDPDSADEALHTIEDTSRTTLREMRRLLDVLRTDSEQPDADLVPQPGLAGIENLVEQVREAGLPVRLRVEGEPVPLDEGVALTVYRIVQEALTNTLKHAGVATATVLLRFERDARVVEVGDNGRGMPARQEPGVGHGLVGMQERIALYGGSLRTGPRSGGGFNVRATIPADQLTGLR